MLFIILAIAISGFAIQAQSQCRAACAACKEGNPAELPLNLRKKCARGEWLGYSRLEDSRFWPNDPRYPNYDYYYNNNRPDLGFGLSP